MDALAVPPKWLFTPTLDNFIAVFSRAMTYEGAAVDTGFDIFFYNSILWGNPGGEALGRGAFYSFDPSVNRVRGWSGSSLVACAVGTTPFADPTHDDYRLHPASPAVDRGLTLPLAACCSI